VEVCAVVKELVSVEGFRLILEWSVGTVAVSTDDAMELCVVDVADELIRVALALSVSINTT
jgi:hypothetical protein